MYRRVAGLVGSAARSSPRCRGAGACPARGHRASQNSFETAITAATVGDLGEAWRTTAAQRGSLSDPVSDGTGVYVNDQEHTYGFAAGTGAPRWSHDVIYDGSATFASQVLVVGDQVLAKGHFPVLFAGGTGEYLDPVTGAVEEQAGEYASIRGDHAVSIAYMANSSLFEESSFRVFDLADPSQDWGDGWYAPLGAFGPLGTPTAGTDAFYLLVNGKLRAYPFDEPADIVPAPPEGHGTKAPLWESGVAGISTEVVLDADGSTAYVGTVTGAVHALDTATGATLWSTDVGSAVSDAPALDGPRLFVPTADGDLVVVNTDGSGVAWTASTGSRLTVQPAIAGPTGGQGVVFTGSEDGTVHAFPTTCPAATCPALWSADAGDGIVGAPAVANGKVFVASGSDLVAYGLSPDLPVRHSVVVGTPVPTSSFGLRLPP